MRSHDLSPPYRASVGFERVAELMDRVLSGDVTQPGYPPCNIEKTADQSYRITLAVAGFTADELSVDITENQLVISGRKAEDDSRRTFLHRGIATRAFERRYHLADHVKVTGATLAGGLLHIDLTREAPEAPGPRRIEIARGDEIEAKAAESAEA